MYLVLHFQRIQSLQHEIKSHSKAEGSTFFDTMRLSSFFRHCETDFFPNFFYCSSHQFLIFCNRMDVQKIPKPPPFTFFVTMRLTGNFKKIRKKIRIFFSYFSFLRAFVVSSCRKSGFRFRVFLSLRYGADLGRSRLVEPWVCRRFIPFPVCQVYTRGRRDEELSRNHSRSDPGWDVEM